MDQYLGCKHREGSRRVPARFQVTGPELVSGTVLPDPAPGEPFKTIRYLEYDMEDFLKSCCDRYEELAKENGMKVDWKTVETPFLDEASDPQPGRDPVASGEGLQCPFCDGIYPTDSFAPVRPGAANQRKAKDVLIGHMQDKQEPTPGKLAPVAAKIIMKVFYAARLARYDLLRAVASLARFITKWTPECDRRLERIMNYVKSTLSYRQIGWVGDDISELNLDLYADANYGTHGGKSTSGVQLHVDGA